jgi:hypothetical protein
VKRLSASIWRDFRVQLRSGYPWFSALAALIGIAFFARIPQGNSDRLAAIASLAFSALTTLPFLISQVQEERREGTLALLDATPLRPHEYLLSKAKSLAIPSMAMNTLFVLVSRGPYFNPLPFWIGLSCSGMFFTLVGFLCVAWGDAALKACILGAFAAVLLFATAPLHPAASALAWLHPLAGPALLIRASYEGSHPATWIEGLGTSCFWIGGALLSCRNAFSRLRGHAP